MDESHGVLLLHQQGGLTLEGTCDSSEENNTKQHKTTSSRFSLTSTVVFPSNVIIISTNTRNLALGQVRGLSLTLMNNYCNTREERAGSAAVKPQGTERAQTVSGLK